MTDELLDECLTKLAGKARMNGIFWDDSVAVLYASVLSPLNDETGVSVVESAVFERPRLPDVMEVRRMAGIHTPQPFHQTRDHSQPGHELQREGVPAYELMKQGFLKKYRENHPKATEADIPDEFRKLFKKLDARSRGIIEEDDDPFRWRPGDPLPPESDDEKARKRALVERLRREISDGPSDQ